MNVLSYSIWGPATAVTMHEVYWASLVTALIGDIGIYRGWEIRVYHDASIETSPVRDLLARMSERWPQIKIVPCSGERYPGLCQRMLWRVLPLFDPEVEILECRDTDSLPTAKERKAVEWFVTKGVGRGDFIHMMRSAHAHATPIMGGMVGFHCPTVRESYPFKSFDELLAHRKDLSLTTMNQDQIFLSDTFVTKAIFVAPRCSEHIFEGPSMLPGTPVPLDQFMQTTPDMDPATVKATDNVYEESPWPQWYIKAGQIYHIYWAFHSMNKYKVEAYAEVVEMIKADDAARGFLSKFLGGAV